MKSGGRDYGDHACRTSTRRKFLRSVASSHRRGAPKSTTDAVAIRITGTKLVRKLSAIVPRRARSDDEIPSRLTNIEKANKDKEGEKKEGDSFRQDEPLLKESQRFKGVGDRGNGDDPERRVETNPHANAGEDASRA